MQREMKSWWCRGGGGKCVSKRLRYPVVILVILISNIGVNLCSTTSSAGERDEYDSWRQWKQNSLGRSLKPRHSSEKSVAKQSKHHQQQQSAVASGIEYVGKSSRGGGKKVNYYPMSPHGEENGRGKIESGYGTVLARQGGGGGGGGGGWGWGWPSHGGGGGGSYDVYTIIAVAAFAALFGALMYELMGGSSRRSYDAPSFSMPSVSLGLDSEKLPEVMVKIGDWIANSSWFDSISNDTKSIKELSNKIGVRKWFDAFKKDPVEYQCIRKMACETLATSALAEKSLKSDFGGAFLSVFGNFIENGNQLEDLVKQIVGNPKKCDELVIGGYCEET